jgi:multicomponent K+:H+ antiporter subunit A
VRSLILHVASRAILPVIAIFSIDLLVRGHHQPGGGFIAGLVTCAGIVLQALAAGVDVTAARLGRYLRPASSLGIAVAIATGTLAWAASGAFLTQAHGTITLEGRPLVEWSTSLLFDLGVYLVVVGTTTTILWSFIDREASGPASGEEEP